MALSRRVLKELAERRCHVRVPRVMSREERLRVHRTLAGVWALGSLAAAPIAPAPRHDFPPKRVVIDQDVAEQLVPGITRHATR